VKDTVLNEKAREKNPKCHRWLSEWNEAWSGEGSKHQCEIRTERHRAEGNISKGIWHQVALWGLIYCQELPSLSVSKDTQ
jgi:hypothetical protein